MVSLQARRIFHDEKSEIEKSDYIYTASLNEWDYLSSVFNGTEINHKFFMENSDFHLYIPTTVGGRKMVFYFSQSQRYGKFGS